MPTETPLTDEINALTQYANTITGQSNTCLSDAVETLADGYGGGGGGISVKTGTFTLANDLPVFAAGTVVPVGLTEQPDCLIVWMDRDSFNETAGGGGYWYAFSLFKKAMLNNLPNMRYNNSLTTDDEYANVDWVLATKNSTWTINDELVNSVGYALAGSNIDKHNIASDGTVTVARYSTARSSFYAGTYHYIAIKGAYAPVV